MCVLANDCADTPVCRLHRRDVKLRHLPGIWAHSSQLSPGEYCVSWSVAASDCRNRFNKHVALGACVVLADGLCGCVGGVTPWQTSWLPDICAVDAGSREHSREAAS